MGNKYSFYLFSQLFHYIFEAEVIDLGYDEIFIVIDKYQELYRRSEFNTDKKSEYQCVQEFLRHNQKQIARDLNFRW